MTRSKKKSRNNIRKLALDQIKSYFNEIEKIKSDNLPLANRYLDICRRISMRCKVRIPRSYKINICNNCKKLLIPGITSRVRIRNNKKTHITITCLYCKNQKRFYINKNENR
ncbi:MAG: ribonuclease P protein component 4 [Candidatus Helarchaeota archaeon]